MFLGELLGGAASIVSNIFGKNKEAKLQKEFAQNGIQWKVEDALKAGVHPLYALGANTMSYSPVGIGDMGGAFQSMGAGVDRAMEATRDGPGRIGKAVERLALERSGLENDKLRAEIALTRSQIGPPMPRPVYSNDPTQISGNVPGSTPIRLGPNTVIPSSPWSDAQVVEDRYADGVSNIYGGISAARDLYRYYIDPWMTKHFDPYVKPADRALGRFYGRVGRALRRRKGSSSSDWYSAPGTGTFGY